MSSAVTLGTLENIATPVASTLTTKTVTIQKPAMTTASTAAGSVATPSGGQPATVTVLTSGTGTSGTKTIVVVPVTSGGGDGQAAKKFKVG